jgi:hypothetical protein
VPSETGRQYQVHPYSLDALLKLTAELSGKNIVDDIREKRHPRYLNEYLKHGEVKTIVVERRYVDRDYLEDFAAYYVRCFEQYDRHCGRLHFFTESFTDRGFRKILSLPISAPEMQRFRDSYFGFIVVKPLPQTVFGRTCLRTYSTAGTNRHFPVTRRFSANLFGIPLDLPETLPFQEQDSVVAACATSALWSALQATAKEFQHPLLTPIEITRAATDFLPAESRIIPNRSGLSTAMMAEAIRGVGLEPLLWEVPDNSDDTLRSALYAYLRGRVPIIMGVTLADVSRPKAPKLIGEHAVAVTGYHLSGKRAARARKTGFRHRATCIDKIYVHDDQLGPFARMQFDGARVKEPVGRGRVIASQSLSTSWESADGSMRVRAIPRILLIPLYHKVRIAYADVFEAVIQLDGFLKTLAFPPQHKGLADLEWDIHLTTVNELKVSLQQNASLIDANRLRWLTRSMPRFLWRAQARTDKQPILDILFDATDIHTSNGIHGVIFYDEDVHYIIRYIARSLKPTSVPDIGSGALRILKAIAADPIAPA